MTRVLRHEVPVDDTVHLVLLAGPILHVAARERDVVEVWVQDKERDRPVRLLVVGTGQRWPDGAIHLGTALVPGERLVWHLLGLPT